MKCLGWACAFGIALAAGHAVAADPPPAVDIRTADGRVLIAADQIVRYDWDAHTVTLRPGVRTALAKWLLSDGAVSGVPFVVAVGGKPAYTGTATTVLSSRSFATAVIVVDDPGAGDDRLRIQLGYPGANFFKGPDPRTNDRVRSALAAAGKLAPPDKPR